LSTQKPRSKTKKSQTPAVSPWGQQDPHAERESQKYANPIPSREFILEKLGVAGVPLKWTAIAELLAIDTEEGLEAVRRRLKAMEREGQVVRNRRGDYGLPHKMDLVRGRVTAHQDGFGFLIPDEGGPDVFLSEKQMLTLLHGDRALVSITGLDRRGRREGALVEVLERGTEELAGRYFHEHRLAFVEPNNRRIAQSILIPPGERGRAKHGEIVLVKLISYPTKHQPPIGRVIKVMGEHMAPGMEIDISIHDHNLPNEWSTAALAEAEKLPKTIDANARKGREDLRQLPLVTIDGEDSRDFDDAVYCEPHGKGWRLLVAIADVSHYVRPGTALDEAAKERGNSVYFPNQVIPMLPEALSNELCSLKPQVDRLCMVCEIFVNHHGGVRQFRFFEGVMCSAARLTYTQVAAALAGDKKAVSAEILPYLQNLHKLYGLLHARRLKRGAIDFDTTETRIIFGPERKIDNIVPVIRNDAHKLIEEMMLLANVATAEFLLKEEIPALFRVHQGPTEEKLTNLRTFLNGLGLRLGGKESPTAAHYAKLLSSVQERPDCRMIQTVMLRSLQMAVYSPDNHGHFGLAYEAYAHFTSPIRRYPDLLVHRAIRHRLQGKSLASFPYSRENMLSLGEHCSMTERRADEATRDVVYWLKCEYMRNKVGEIYEGTINAVTGFGLFVELDGIFVEGLVHVTALKNDYYHFDPVHHRLRGERSGTQYQLSGRVQVKVVRVNMEDRKIDFELA